MATFLGNSVRVYGVALLVALLSLLLCMFSLGAELDLELYQNSVLKFSLGLLPSFNFAMPAQPAKSHFRVVQDFKTDYAPCNITQYVSERSGMNVVVAYRKGPKINGYFTLATEILDDSGAPHTLEHLIFMGSKNYRYKGLLDKLASRAYSGTNAWTATDHTAYTLESAGWEGFSQILPVYLEHVLFPTLTEESILTEVWHVDGEGNDAGVVYSEMQDLQFRSSELMDIRARHHLYDPSVGFRYETGGMVAALRQLPHDRIRDFHHEMYQPRNLCLVLVGEVDQNELLQILDEFEEGVKDDIPAVDSPYKRPWIDSAQPAPLNKTTIDLLEFPEEDESHGEIAIGFFGPNCIDLVESSAINVLLTYLCGSSVSVLENVVVEREELASSVSYWWDARPNSVIWLQPTGVATDKLEFVEKRIFELLKDVASKPMDMNYMRECIRRERRQVKYHAETSESFFATNIITDFLFGDRNGTSLRQLESLDEYETLEKWTDEQWRAFLNKWMADAHHVSILGKPSAQAALELREAEKNRIAQRKEELGSKGLEEWAEKVKNAKQKNDQPIPAEIIDKWRVPETDSIHFIESDTARTGRARSLGAGNGTTQALLDKQPEGKLPLFLQFESVPTNFVHITMHAGTSNVPVELKPLMPIFCDIFFNTHIMRNGSQVNFEQVVMELERDTVSYGLDTARSIGDPDGVMLQFQVEKDKYAAAVNWIQTMMFDSVFDPVRLRAAVSKALADIPESKRDGRSMAVEVDNAIHLKKSSLTVAKRVLVQAAYYVRLRRLLKSDPDKVVSWFETLRSSLFTFQNVRVMVAADFPSLSDPVTTWDSLSQKLGSPEEMIKIEPPRTQLNEEGREPGKSGVTIVPMSTLDSSFSVSTAQGLNGTMDERLAAVMVAICYLEAPEGPLWNAVRGAGYAYGSYFARDLESGALSYRVFRSPDASKAITASRKAITDILDGTQPIEKHLLEGAVSQIVVIFVDEQATMPSAAQQNFVLGVVRGLPHDWSKRILKAVSEVTEDEIKAAMRNLILPVFEPGKSNVVVTCGQLMREGMETAFAGMGYKTQVKTLDEFHDNYGLEEGDVDPENKDEDEDEDEFDSDKDGDDYSDEDSEED